MTTATMWSNQELDVMKRDLKQLCTLEETQEHLNHKFTLVEIAKKKLEILHGNIPVNKSDNSTGNVQHIEGQSKSKEYTLAEIAACIFPEKSELFTSEDSLRKSGATRYTLKLKNVMDNIGIQNVNKETRYVTTQKNIVRPVRVNTYRLTEKQLNQIKSEMQDSILHPENKDVAQDGIKYVTPAQYELMKANINLEEEYVLMTIKEVYTFLYGDNGVNLQSYDKMYIRIKNLLLKHVNTSLVAVAYVLRGEDNYTSPSKTYKITYNELSVLADKLKSLAVTDSEVPMMYRQTTIGTTEQQALEETTSSNEATLSTEKQENNIEHNKVTEEQQRVKITTRGDLWKILTFFTVLLYAITCSIILIGKL